MICPFGKIEVTVNAFPVLFGYLLIKSELFFVCRRINRSAPDTVYVNFAMRLSLICRHRFFEVGKMAIVIIHISVVHNDKVGKRVILALNRVILSGKVCRKSSAERVSEYRRICVVRAVFFSYILNVPFLSGLIFELILLAGNRDGAWIAFLLIPFYYAIAIAVAVLYKKKGKKDDRPAPDKNADIKDKTKSGI